jgi:hypothetical protein
LPCLFFRAFKLLATSQQKKLKPPDGGQQEPESFRQRALAFLGKWRSLAAFSQLTFWEILCRIEDVGKLTKIKFGFELIRVYRSTVR